MKTFFSGQFQVTIDENGRFSFPSKQMAQMDERGVIVNLGLEGNCVWIIPKSYWQQLVERITSASSPLDESTNKAFMRFFVSYSFEQEIEERNRRMPINPQLLEKVGIKDKALVVGLVKYFELWDPDQYQLYLENQKEKRNEAMRELGGSIKF